VSDRNVKRVIAYYPGAGGNRYLRYTLGQEYNTLNRAYDEEILDQMPGHRYLLPNQIEDISNQTVLTHCLNHQRIREIFGAASVFLIVSNLKECLRREWALNGHTFYLKMTEHFKINDPTYDEFPDVKSAWATIEYHNKYYKEYPFDIMESGALYTKIDITKDNDEFSKTMRSELALYKSDVFDFAYDMYTMTDGDIGEYGGLINAWRSIKRRKSLI
jgi:hypothetical protein